MEVLTKTIVKKIIIFLAILGLSFFNVNAAKDKPSTAEYLEDDYQKNKRLADQGNAYAQLKIHENYLLGVVVESDLEKAIFWLKKSAESGNATAQKRLGDSYKDGEPKGYISEDQLKAVEWYKKSAQQGNEMAQYQLGRMYLHGSTIPKDFSESFKWLKKSSDQNIRPASKFYIAMLYESGDVTFKKDAKKSSEWLRKSADQGYADAQFFLGLNYMLGSGVLENRKKTVYWYKKAVAQGHPGAQYALSMFYDRGWVVDKDYSEAFRLRTLASDQGEDEAHGALAGMYIYGVGTNKDMSKAKGLIEKAFESNNIDIRDRAAKTWKEFELWKY
jgi:TPR repeat protein